MTSGDMYIGVPVNEFFSPPSRMPAALAIFERWNVRVFLAITFAAPKSTNLRTPKWSSRMSVTNALEGMQYGKFQILTVGLDIAMDYIL